MIPKLIVNFKNYRNSTGKNALKLAKIVEKVSKKSKVLIGICVNALDLALVCKNVDIPVFLQGSDSHSFGAHTGAVIPTIAKFYGASGVLINHIEKPLSDLEIEKTIKESKKSELKILLCVEDIERAKILEKNSADMILLEQCDLLGSCVSITEKAPELINEASEILGIGKFMIGAGVSQEKHIKTALDRGAYGVIVSNSVVNSSNPEEKLMDLVRAFK